MNPDYEVILSDQGGWRGSHESIDVFTLSSFHDFDVVRLSLLIISICPQIFRFSSRHSQNQERYLSPLAAMNPLCPRFNKAILCPAFLFIAALQAAAYAFIISGDLIWPSLQWITTYVAFKRSANNAGWATLHALSLLAAISPLFIGISIASLNFYVVYGGIEALSVQSLASWSYACGDFKILSGIHTWSVANINDLEWTKLIGSCEKGDQVGTSARI